MHPVKERFQRIKQFVVADLWQIRQDGLHPMRSALLKLTQVAVVAFHSFRGHQCMLRASSLTYYSILSIVPVVAMAFGVASGFGLEKRLERELLSNFPGQEEVIAKVITFANSLLQNTKGGLIAGVGVVVLCYTVIKVLSHIESSLNTIWEIETHRSLGRKISDYLSMLMAAPVLFIVSGSATVYIRSQVLLITQKLAFLSTFDALILFALKVLPLGLVWLLFSIIYLLMPNTRVRLDAGILAGIIAGTAYQMVQWVYIYFQIGVSRNNAIYGSFAALPLFLIWLQMSWIIFLAGAAVSAAWEKTALSGFSPECDQLNVDSQRLIGLRILHFLIRRFIAGASPPTEREISAQTRLPTCLVRSMLTQLTATRMVSAVQMEGKGALGYQPGRDTEGISISSVLNALNRNGKDFVFGEEDAVFRSLSGQLDSIEALIEKSPANRRIRDI